MCQYLTKTIVECIFHVPLLFGKTIASLSKEQDMLEVTERASEAIKGFLEGREGPQSIRIVLNEGG